MPSDLSGKRLWDGGKRGEWIRIAESGILVWDGCEVGMFGRIVDVHAGYAARRAAEVLVLRSLSTTAPARGAACRLGSCSEAPRWLQRGAPLARSPEAPRCLASRRCARPRLEAPPAVMRASARCAVLDGRVPRAWFGGRGQRFGGVCGTAGMGPQNVPLRPTARSGALVGCTGVFCAVVDTSRGAAAERPSVLRRPNIFSMDLRPSRFWRIVNAAVIIGGLAFLALAIVGFTSGWLTSEDTATSHNLIRGVVGALLITVAALQSFTSRIVLDEHGAGIGYALGKSRFFWRSVSWSEVSGVTALVQSGTLATISLSAATRTLNLDVVHHDGHAAARFIAAHTSSSTWKGFFNQLAAHAAEPP